MNSVRVSGSESVLLRGFVAPAYRYLLLADGSGTFDSLSGSGVSAAPGSMIRKPLRSFITSRVYYAAARQNSPELWFARGFSEMNWTDAASQETNPRPGRAPRGSSRPDWRTRSLRSPTATFVTSGSARSAQPRPCTQTSSRAAGSYLNSPDRHLPSPA